ncbi:MAG: hypothetical protein QM617_03565 [Comamonas sp.]
MKIHIPPQFFGIPFDFDRHPQAATFDFGKGANCQLYAYALLSHFGRFVPPFRSSQLWEDELHTAVVKELEPLDLVLVHDNPNAWGAHVAVCIGEDHVVHLSRKNGVPRIETMEQLLTEPKYPFFIGAKRTRSTRDAKSVA